jgi:hypothetical protein
MVIEKGDGHGDTLEDSQTSDQEQPDPAVLKRREYQRKRYHQNPTPILEKNRRWRQQNPAKARASSRQWAERNPTKVAEASRRSSLTYFQKKRERLYEQGRIQRRQKKETAQAAAQSVNIPSLNPIWDRLSHALSSQQATERQRRTQQRNNP